MGLERDVAHLAARLEDMREKIERVEGQLLSARAKLADLGRAGSDFGHHAVSPPDDRLPDFRSAIEALKRAYPTAVKVWQDLLHAAELAYGEFPAESLSVEGNKGAEAFKLFVDTYRCGRVLDIGCGPAAVPRYLGSVPIESIAAIDPVASSSQHPFVFRQAIAESIPWADSTFETVIAATTLDHVLSLDGSLREIQRIMSPDGRFLAWVGLIPGAQPFDPKQTNIQPIDAYHLFHLDDPWFSQLCSQYFDIEDRIDIFPGSVFFAMSRRKV